MEDQLAFEALKNQFGNHSAAARALGIEPRVYREWRAMRRIPAGRKSHVQLVINTKNGTEPITCRK